MWKLRQWFFTSGMNDLPEFTNSEKRICHRTMRMHISSTERSIRQVTSVSEGIGKQAKIYMKRKLFHHSTQRRLWRTHHFKDKLPSLGEAILGSEESRNGKILYFQFCPWTSHYILGKPLLFSVFIRAGDVHLDSSPCGPWYNPFEFIASEGHEEWVRNSQQRTNTIS